MSKGTTSDVRYRPTSDQPHIRGSSAGATTIAQHHETITGSLKAVTPEPRPPSSRRRQSPSGTTLESAPIAGVVQW
jgi:hypothetical protein